MIPWSTSPLAPALQLYIIYKGLVKMLYPRNAGFELLHSSDVFGEVPSGQKFAPKSVAY